MLNSKFNYIARVNFAGHRNYSTRTVFSGQRLKQTSKFVEKRL